MTVAPPPARFAQACLLMAPIEDSSSFLWGSGAGPEAVADELARIDHFDADLGRGLAASFPIHRAGVRRRHHDLPGALRELTEETAAWLERDAFVLTLGGEHTVTLGPLEAVVGRYGPVGLVQLDAHGDLRGSYEGDRYSHACAMRHAVEDLGVRLVGLGVRSMCQEEAELASSRDDIAHLWPRQIVADPGAVARALDALPPLVYLTIDMDVFDPTVCPGVGTPEAGGLRWEHVAAIVDSVAATRRIVGADVVELAPSVERDRSVRLAARVALRVLLQSTT
jgi:agmatinase